MLFRMLARRTSELLSPTTMFQGHFSTLATRTLKRLPAAYYRGGTSRAVMFKQEDLPTDRSLWPAIFLGVIGSPDSNGRQLIGMGGGLSSLSKVCVVGRGSPTSGADVDYTFVALGVRYPEVDFSSNCGNMTSAIGPFAVRSGLVKKPQDGQTTVRIRNTNTGKLIDATFPVTDGELTVDGEFEIDGVDGKAARIELAFLDPAGSKTGKLLPTDNATNVIEGTRVSLIDCGNPCCFVGAEDMGVDGKILPESMDADASLLQRLDVIRRKASVLMSLSRTESSATSSVPKIAIVSKPESYKTTSGVLVDGRACDLLVRAMSVGQPHRAVPITVAMALAAASQVTDSVVNRLVSQRRVNANGLTLGHPSGKLVVGTLYDERGSLTGATVYRTARALFEGQVLWK